uniref:LAM_G_DOMAIN domain-containing protein n=1 Tax=Haemonchus contortus TaxID=6289 RepID=A0A7I4Y5F9_HAECO|nr:Laminin G domain containing protein [Haemonchus contortus]
MGSTLAAAGFLLFLTFIVVNGIVFQGSCSDSALLCEQLCITLSPETYECGCWNDHILQPNGISCKVISNAQETDTATEATAGTTRLKRDRTIWPREKDTAPLSFTGHNYAEFPISDTTYLETNITIEFRTSEKRDAILFFAGQFNADDYISVAIIGPNIILRHDCGEGAIEDMYRGPFALNEWHSVTVWRKFCDRTSLKVDSKPLMVDLTEQFRFYKGISMDEGVFVGGAPSRIEALDSKVGTTNGFHGCVRKLIINNDVLLDTENEVNTAVNLQDLEYCNPITQTQTAPQPKIREIDLSTGQLYQHSSKSRSALSEVNGIQPFTTTRLATTAKPTTVTHATSKAHFGNSVDTTTPSVDLLPLPVLKVAEFSGASHFTVPAPADIVDYLDLRINFKPNQHAGLLFYWQDMGRYLAVFMERGYVNVQVTMGADTAILRSESPITLHQWHRAEIWRTGKGILMKVDRQSWVESQLMSIRGPLTEPGMLYIGGYDGDLPPHVALVSGFHGCMKKIRLNGRSIAFRPEHGQHIRECGADPCAAAGCPRSCSSTNDEFVCLCEWPKHGKTCEQETKRLLTMRFSGHSYLELKKAEQMDQVTGDTLKMEINVKLSNVTDTTSPLRSQLLVFAGENGVTADFFRLLITPDRHVQVMMNLGSGLVTLTHPTPLIPGRWSRVEVARHKRQLTLSINDATPITTMAPGDSEELNVYKGLFIGGMPPDSQHLDGFRGCIEFVQIGSVVVDHPEEAATAVNIENCDL